MSAHTTPNFTRQKTLPALTGRTHPCSGTQRFRLLIALSGALLLSTTVLLTLLNALSVFHLSAIWLTFLDVVLTVLGVGGTLGQWLIPLTAPLSISATGSLSPESRVITHDQTTLSPVEVLRRIVETELNPRLPKGALVIVTGERALSMPIHLIPHRTWLTATSAQAIPGPLPGTHTEYVKHIRCGESVLCAAIFRDQVPDEYLAQSDFHASTSVPIFEHESSSIDWR